MCCQIKLTKVILLIFLNSYFVNIGESLASAFDGSDECEVNSTKSRSRFRFSEITSEDLYKQLSRMTAGKATGLDDVSPRLLKAAACHISQPLTHIMNLGLRLGIAPERWKHSKVTPIFIKMAIGLHLVIKDPSQ